MADYIPIVIYILCALTSVTCAVLLLRGYGRSRTRFLLWSGLCFAGLALNNIILFVDKVLTTSTDLSIYRTSAAVVALALLLYGLIWDAE
jgi:hypothetical protein